MRIRLRGRPNASGCASSDGGTLVALHDSSETQFGGSLSPLRGTDLSESEGGAPARRVTCGMNWRMAGVLTPSLPVFRLSPQQTEIPQRLVGVALMCGALAMFASLDAMAKVLSQSLPVSQVVWARYAGHFVFALAFVLPSRDRFRLWRTNSVSFQMIRGSLLLAGTACNFFALQHLQLAVTSAFFFTVPLIVAALSVPLLGERVGPHRWAAIGVGFIGVLLVARPGMGVMHWAVSLSLLTALFTGLYQISTRRAALTDDPRTSQLYVALAGVLVMTPMLLVSWQDPGWRGWLLFAAMGLVAGVGHYWLTLAHRLAPASALAPFFYVHILWMTGLGFLVFGDVPDQWTVAGAAVVVAAGLYLVRRERLQARRGT